MIISASRARRSTQLRRRLCVWLISCDAMSWNCKAVTAPPMAPALEAELPEVEAASGAVAMTKFERIYEAVDKRMADTAFGQAVLRHRPDRAVVIKNNRAGTGGALVEGKDVLLHRCLRQGYRNSCKAGR